MLSASKTALQSALDAILAELAALQLSGSGVVNAPAWAGFTTWELLRGSSVVRNFVAPLSAAPEAALALQTAVRFPDDGGADEVVAAIEEQILDPTDVSLSNWTVRSSSGCSGTE